MAARHSRFAEETTDMSKLSARDPESDAGAELNEEADTKPKEGGGEKQAMEEAQEDAAEERASERGYQ